MALVVAVALAACAAGAARGMPVDGLSTAAAPPDLRPLGCNDRPDPDRPQFVVGYGSLMQDESRMRTAPRAGPAHPIELQGYERGWLERGEAVGGFGATYLGVREKAGGRLNAVIYRIDAVELLATDDRESSYCRREVAHRDVAPLDEEFPLATDGQAWIYVIAPRRAAAPDADFPIVQSYVDVFLSGCLEQEARFHLAGFSRQCVSTTAGWSEHWVNDRIYPRRPFVFQPRARQIDRLLAAGVPSQFRRIRIEAAGARAR